MSKRKAMVLAGFGFTMLLLFAAGSGLGATDSVEASADVAVDGPVVKDHVDDGGNQCAVTDDCAGDSFPATSSLDA